GRGKSRRRKLCPTLRVVHGTATDGLARDPKPLRHELASDRDQPITQAVRLPHPWAGTAVRSHVPSPALLRRRPSAGTIRIAGHGAFAPRPPAAPFSTTHDAVSHTEIPRIRVIPTASHPAP